MSYYMKSLWLMEKIMNIFFLFEECENVKERTAQLMVLGKKQNVFSSWHAGGTYAYIACDTKLLMSVI